MPRVQLLPRVKHQLRVSLCLLPRVQLKHQLRVQLLLRVSLCLGLAFA